MALATSVVQRVQDLAAGGQRVIFVHVPKCGGTSVRAALRNSFTVAGLGSRSLDPVASRRSAHALGEDVLALREQWVLYEAARHRNTLLMGHFPCSPVLRELAHDYVIITLLREPHAHVLSEFFYNRDKSHSQHARVPPSTRLKDYLAGPTAAAAAWRYIDFFTEPALRGKRSDASLAAARATLDTLDVVGTLETLPRFVSDVRRRTGKGLRIGWRNTGPTPAAQRHHEVDAEANAMLAELCAPATSVYEHVRARER